MAHKKFYVDEVMAAHDRDMDKPVPGYRFSNGRNFHGQNDVGSGAKATVSPTTQAPLVDTPATAPIAGKVQTDVLSVFQGTPWSDSSGVWNDNEVWTDG